jgi:CheY-like chemotaxis protein
LSNKALRILIADEQHFQRMRIERLFNQLDYYRVVPVHNLAELLTLVDYGGVPFDLVVINASMAEGELNLYDFFLDHPQVHHVLIYDADVARLPAVSADGQQRIQVIQASMPELPFIERSMAIIESRQPFVGTVISVS